MKRIAFIASIALAACTPTPLQLSAAAISAIVSAKVVDGVFGKVFFDPVWEFFLGKPAEAELQALKNDIVREATKSIVESIIPSANAADGGTFKCDRGEDIAHCQQRVSDAAQYGFDVYAPKFVAAWRSCRDDIALTPVTGALDYTDQVHAITGCIADKGFQREIAVIVSYTQRLAR